MSSPITVPLWLALVVALLAVWALLDRLLMPSARWFIRSRANKVLEEVSQRLPIHIRPFQQVRRQAMIASPFGLTATVSRSHFRRS